MSNTPRADEIIKDFLSGNGEAASIMLLRQDVEQLETELADKEKQFADARAEAEHLRIALETLYSWVKAEADHFGANAPDDDMIVMVSSAIKAAKGEI